MGIEEFKKALGADVVIEGVARKGALSVPEALAVRDWWDQERRIRDMGPHRRVGDCCGRCGQDWPCAAAILGGP